MERMIADAYRADAAQQMQTTLAVAPRPLRPSPADRPPDPRRKQRKMPTPPSWWHGDQEAAHSSMLAMQQLRRGTKR